MTQFCAMCQVVTSEGVSPITICHIFTSHNLPRDELWYKIVPFLMVLAQLNSISSEGVSPITICHIFTSHNLPRDELWYKIVPFFMVLAQLNSIRQ